METETKTRIEKEDASPPGEIGNRHGLFYFYFNKRPISS